MILYNSVVVVVVHFIIIIIFWLKINKIVASSTSISE